MPRILIALMLFVSLTQQSVAEEPFVLYQSKSSYADVMEALKLAIEERGMTINSVMHLSDMLERTGKDLGDEKKIYEKAESIEFCSALLSRKMTGSDPRRIINCPYIISVYTLPDQSDTTYVIHRRVNALDKSDVMNEVETMLEDLAKAAAEGW